MPSFYKVTLKRSTIGLHPRIRAIVKSLGLKRLQSSSYLPISPMAAGEILRVKELVQVENVDEIPPVKAIDRSQYGYRVIGNILEEKAKAL